MEKGGVSGLFGKSKKYLSIIVLMIILFSIFNMTYLSLKISKFQEREKISANAVQTNINVCLDVEPPAMSPIGNLIAHVGQNFVFKVNATSPSNRTVYYFDNTTLFDINQGTGLINFTPTNQQIGNYSVQIWSTHNICGLNTSETIRFVIMINHAPVWMNNTPVSQNITEDSPYFLNVSQYVYDPDNDTVFFFSNNSYVEFPSFNLTLSGILNFTADDIDVGKHAVKMNASDTQNYSTKNFTFNVINVNEPPIITSFPPEFDLCEDEVFKYTVFADDEDLNIPNSPEELFYYDNSPMFVINEQTGEIFFVAMPEFSGHNPVRIYVTDEEELDYQNTDFYIIPINDGPVLTDIGAKTIWINETWDFVVDAHDQEDGGNDEGNLNFSDDTDLFDIDSVSGRIQFTPTDEQNGTYNVSICVEDQGIPRPENYSFCGEDSYLPKTECKNFSLTVTLNNRPPVITSYDPTDLDLEINETESILFSITKEDPDGTIPTTYWFKNGELVNWTSDSWLFETIEGDAGFYTIKVEITDGELNDSMEWNVTVIAPISPPSGGGGGGGGACNETWICTDWFDCVDLSRIPLNLSEKSKMAWNELWKTGCEEKNMSLDICGIQVRYCNDASNCSSAKSQPFEYMPCRLMPPPSCEDGIRNCHRGSCELLIDCGGPCVPCPQEIGRTEYPRTRANCGDKRCEISELFTCPDCYMFWFLCMVALISVLIATYIIKRRRISLISKQKELKIKAKIEAIKENMVEIRRYIELRDLRNAKAIFKKTEKLASSLKEGDLGTMGQKLWLLKKELFGERRYVG